MSLGFLSEALTTRIIEWKEKPPCGFWPESGKILKEAENEVLFYKSVMLFSSTFCSSLRIKILKLQNTAKRRLYPENIVLGAVAERDGPSHPSLGDELLRTASFTATLVKMSQPHSRRTKFLNIWWFSLCCLLNQNCLGTIASCCFAVYLHNIFQRERKNNGNKCPQWTRSVEMWCWKINDAMYN